MFHRRFEREADIRLITAIQENPLIYNPYHEDYKNGPLKNMAWKKISAIVQEDPVKCKKRWRDIRDHYFKKLKAGHTPKPGFPKWALFDRLHFLSEVTKERPFPNASASTPQADEDDDVPLGALSDIKCEMEAYEGDELERNSRSPFATNYENDPWAESHRISLQRLDLLQQLVESREREDDIDLFMKSIALTLKRLPVQLQNQAKVGILSVVTNLSEQQ